MGAFWEPTGVQKLSEILDAILEATNGGGIGATGSAWRPQNTLSGPGKRKKERPKTKTHPRGGAKLPKWKRSLPKWAETSPQCASQAVDAACAFSSGQATKIDARARRHGLARATFGSLAGPLGGLTA